MSETDRVQRWREAKRQHGLKACTIWLSADEELRLKDLATKGHCSPSAIMQQALAQFRPPSQQRISNVPDIELIREMIRAELAAMPAPLGPVTDNVTVTVIEPTTDHASERGSVAVPSNSYETDTDTPEETPEADVPQEDTPTTYVTDTNSNVTETATPAAASPRPAPEMPAPPGGTRKRGRPSTLRQPIMDLVRAHPDGLTAVQIKVHLDVDNNIGDILQGMVRNHLLAKQGSGAQVRYRTTTTL